MREPTQDVPLLASFTRIDDPVDSPFFAETSFERRHMVFHLNNIFPERLLSIQQRSFIDELIPALQAGYPVDEILNTCWGHSYTRHFICCSRVEPMSAYFMPIRSQAISQLRSAQTTRRFVRLLGLRRRLLRNLKYAQCQFIAIRIRTANAHVISGRSITQRA